MPRKKKQPVKKVAKKKAPVVKKKVAPKAKPKVPVINYYWEIVSLETGDDDIVDRIVYELHGKLEDKIVEQTAAIDVLPQSTIASVSYTKLKKEDVISYKITRTKRENIITNNKYSFGYDNGKNRYKYKTELLNVNDLYPEYDGFNYYNIKVNCATCHVPFYRKRGQIIQKYRDA